MTDEPTTIADLRDSLRAQTAALVAERAARRNAEARLYAYGHHQPQCPLWMGLRGVCTCGYSRLLEQPSPFVTELEAARAVVWAAKEAEFTTVALGLAIRAYDEATKGRET